MDCSLPSSPVHGIFPGKNTGKGCHALLQGVFLTQGSNPHVLHLLHLQGGSLPLAPPGESGSGQANCENVTFEQRLKEDLRELVHVNMKKSESAISQSCPTLRNPKGCSLPGCSVHGILQSRILEQVAIPFSRGLPDPGIKPRSLEL